jgi:hypothetical protein
LKKAWHCECAGAGKIPGKIPEKIRKHGPPGISLIPKALVEWWPECPFRSGGSATSVVAMAEPTKSAGSNAQKLRKSASIVAKLRHQQFLGVAARVLD